MTHAATIRRSSGQRVTASRTPGVAGFTVRRNTSQRYSISHSTVGPADQTVRLAAEAALAAALVAQAAAELAEAHAETAETNAETAETNAETAAAAAADSLTDAVAAAGNALSSEVAAAASEAAAAVSASDAASDANAAATSATAAAGSATSASTSATTATTQANAATTQAGNAATSATAAAGSATTATTQAGNAATSATAAANSATAAATSATNAGTSETNAAASASAAAASYDSFDDRYLGAKAASPTLDNDGNALINGALYWNSTTSLMKVYDLGSTTWKDATAAVSILRWSKTMAGGETSLSGNDDTAQTLAYTPGFEIVIINGSVMRRADYTATNGTSITGLPALTASDEVVVLCYSAITIATALPLTGGTVTGNITFQDMDEGVVLAGGGRLFDKATYGTGNAGSTNVRANNDSFYVHKEDESATILGLRSGVGLEVLDTANVQTFINTLLKAQTQKAAVQAIAGDRVLLASGSVASGTTVIDFALPTGYAAIEIDLYNTQPATAGNQLITRFSIDNAVTYKSGASDYKWFLEGQIEDNTWSSGGSSAASYIQLGSTQSNGGAAGQFNIRIPAPDTSGWNKCIMFSSVMRAEAIGKWWRTAGGGLYNGGDVLTHVRLGYASGNISNMIYRVYGVL
jgi:hypothetical protein